VVESRRARRTLKDFGGCGVCTGGVSGGVHSGGKWVWVEGAFVTASDFDVSEEERGWMYVASLCLDVTIGVDPYLHGVCSRSVKCDALPCSKATFVTSTNRECEWVTLLSAPVLMRR